MDISTVFSNLDGITLTIFIGFFGIYLTIHFSLFEAVGDLNNIRDRAIYSLAKQHEGLPVLTFLQTIKSESSALFSETKRSNKPLRVFLTSFFFVGIITIGYTAFANIIPFLPSREWILYAYSALLSISMYLLYREVVFFREFRRLEKKYPSKDDCDTNNILLLIDEKER